MHLWALDINYKGSDERGYDACCPAHDDRTPSFHLGEGHDGRALVYCHAGCTLEEIADALHLAPGDLFEDADRAEDAKPTKREVLERYDYTDEHGKLLYQVERMQPKGFRQRRPNDHGEFEYTLGDVRRVIYRLPAVIEAVKAGKWVSIVEGERDVHTVEAEGHVATTCPGGAGKWRDSYSVIFKDAKVVIIMDVDPVDEKTGKRPGQEHAEQVRQSLDGIAAKIMVMQPAVGKDVTDHVKAGLKLGELVRAGEPTESKERLRVLTAPEVMALPDPDEAGYLLGPLIYQGYRIVIGGHTGHGKTTLTMHMVASAIKGEDFLDPEWHGRGDLRALIVDVEQGTKSVKRVLREVGLDRNPNVRYLRVPDGLALDSDEDAVRMMEKIFVAGHFDIVLADPLYKLGQGDMNDARAADRLMRRFDDWRERYGFSLLLPMHCRKPNDRQGLSPHDLFGSSAFQWGAEVLLGVERKSDTMTWLHWWKDRDGEVAENDASIGSHWEVRYERGKGFRRYIRERVAATPKFDLPRFIYEQIRDRGPQTRNDVRETLWFKHQRAYNMREIDKALGRLNDYGVTHNGAHRLGDRVYQLPVSMLDQAEA
jgi:hypothetical protein